MRRVHQRFGLLLALAALLSPPARATTSATPTFGNVSVHDPSIVRDGSTYWVFGSHLASAKSTDLMHWTQVSTSPAAGNALVPNPATEFAEALAWAQTTTFWAPDNLKLSDGLYHFYCCACKGDSPRSALGIATSKSIGGPYVNQRIILKSGMWNQTSPDGTIYDATKHPNAVDPAVFFDATGKKLWMVYGSYSGGIFILELDPKTGVPKAGQGYGKKLIGGNHARIEGPYIIYSPETKYYYLFLSFGGLDAAGGYNIRVGRSRAPNGPYVDAEGYDLTKVAGAPGTVFDDASIAPHGVKLMGNWQFLHVSSDAKLTSTGYVSPGHNSVYRNPSTGEYFIVFHTRFVGRGEYHEVRVHPLYFNDAGWPVVAPHRYAGERMETAIASRIPGTYKLINHGKDITATVKTSSLITLTSDHKITGAATGTWSLSGHHNATLKLGSTTYRGVFVRQWDDDNQRWVQAFTVLSANGIAAWGSRVAAPVANTAPTIAKFVNRTIAKSTNTGAIAVTIGDAQLVASALTLTAASSNQTLVPASRLALGGAADARTLTIDPVAGRTGSTKITLTVSDGALKTSTSFTLTVANAPTISKIANQTINEDTATKPLAFKIADADTAVTKLKLTAVSSNPKLVPTSGIVFAGTGANRTVTIKPAKNQSGTATVTLTVSDGALKAQTAFIVTVKAVNDAPTVSGIASQAFASDGSSKTLTFTIDDAETMTSKLTITRASSNPALVPLAAIVLGGTGANRTVKITPVRGATGTGTITLTVSDGTTATKTSFTVTVNAASTSSMAAALPAAAPTLARDLADVAALAGGTVKLSVAASGAGLHYRWFKDDVALAVDDGPVLSLASTAVADAGIYHVVVSGSGGTITSRSASLVVMTVKATVGVMPALPLSYARLSRASLRLDFAGPIAGLEVSALLPPGWHYAGGSATGATAVPAAGDADLLEWTWSQTPPASVSIDALLHAPSSGAALANLQGTLTVHLPHGTTTIPFDAQP